ncbi:MAG: FHA domain-containing protein [Planctomycetota bacterium]|jgi:pSer/pThr/pTyr-binding forkhead associated (FHA) protein
MVSVKATRKLPKPRSDGGPARFLARFQASLVILSGGASGIEYTLDQETISLGRGPGVDLAFDDPAMSRAHAALELVEGGFRIRDLGSTNGIRLNDDPVQVAELKHGDRFQLGDHTFQYVLEERESQPHPYDLSEG